MITEYYDLPELLDLHDAMDIQQEVDSNAMRAFTAGLGAG